MVCIFSLRGKVWNYWQDSYSRQSKSHDTWNEPFIVKWNTSPPLNVHLLFIANEIAAVKHNKVGHRSAGKVIGSLIRNSVKWTQLKNVCDSDLGFGEWFQAYRSCKIISVFWYMIFVDPECSRCQTMMARGSSNNLWEILFFDHPSKTKEIYWSQTSRLIALSQLFSYFFSIFWQSNHQ